MLTEKEIKALAKNGITFELSQNGKYANVYSKGKYKSSIFSTNNTVFFCGKAFVETTTKDIIEYLNSNTTLSTNAAHFTTEELFTIWKKCIIEDRPVKSLEIELKTKEDYLFRGFRRLKLPRTHMERKMFDQQILKKVLKQDSYENAKKYLGGSYE